MQALVTGATGKVGNAVTRALVARGDTVRALVRDTSKARSAVPAGAELVVGDVTDPDSLSAAVDGCDVVFNAMGLPEQWLVDESLFERINVFGTRHVIEAAAKAGVQRVVHTSTIDVFHAAPGGRFDESMLADYPKGTAYERSKQRAELAALDAADGNIEVVFANPAAVYGLGPIGPASIERTMFPAVVRGLLPMVPPGGFGVVFTEGLGTGHLLVAEKGKPGERYILCDTHVTMREMAEAVVRVSGRGRVPRAMPLRLAKGLATVGESASRVIRKPPLIARGQLEFLLWNAAPDSSKAQRDLGWTPTPLDDGVRRTLESMSLL